MQNTIADYAPLIEQYRKENPYLSKSNIAKLIKKQENLPYATNTIRIFMGPSNKPDYNDVWKNDGEEEFNVEIPDTWYKQKSLFSFPGAIKNMLVISDMQIPFHDKQALQAALRFGYDEDIDCILINGDLADFYSISRFNKVAKHRDLEAEVYSVVQFLKGLRKAFPNTPIYLKLGNHELRLETYLNDNASDLAWYSKLSLEELFELKTMGIETISDKRVMKYGQLYIIHGHEYGGKGAVNVARNLLLKAFDNILCGHFHRMDEAYWTPISGDSIGSWVTGCLCGLRPDYMPLNNWVHGFARIVKRDDDTFEVENRKIIRGKIY
jgi:predicted phosphodiesterase